MEFPEISVIIASYNEEKHIEKCVMSVLNQSYSGKLEIIIADGMSTDRTREIIGRLKKSNNNINLIDNPHRYQSAGRNAAIRLSSSPMIAYLDAHSIADEHWLRSLYKSFIMLKENDNKIAGVGSVYYDTEGTNLTKSASVAFRSILAGVTKSSFQKKNRIEQVDNAYACLYDKSKLEVAGMYDEALQVGEDIELNHRLVYGNGFSLYVNPEAVTYYYFRNSLDGIFEQQFRYGYWRLNVVRKLSLPSNKIFGPAVFILIILLSFMLSFFSPVFFLIFIAFITLYFLVLFVNAIYHSMKQRMNMLILVFIYPCIHFGYGFGVLKGIFSKKR